MSNDKSPNKLASYGATNEEKTLEVRSISTKNRVQSYGGDGIRAPSIQDNIVDKQ